MLVPGNFSHLSMNAALKGFVLGISSTIRITNIKTAMAPPPIATALLETISKPLPLNKSSERMSFSQTWFYRSAVTGSLSAVKGSAPRQKKIKGTLMYRES